MSVVTTSLDAFGQALWNVSLQVTVLISLVALASLLARKAPPTFRYALWCVVLVRLCVPLSLSLPFGLMEEVRGSAGWLAARFQSPAITTATPAAESAPRSAGSTVERAAPDAAPSFTPTPRLGSLTTSRSHDTPAIGVSLGPAWLATVLLGALIVVWRARRVACLLRDLPEVHRPEVVALLETLRRRMHVTRTVSLRQADAVVGEIGPMTVGVFRPVVILPRGMAAEWPTEEVAPVLMHELAHIRRLDLAVNGVQIAVQLLYFFHPLVWYANRRIRQERELICDDLAAGLAAGDRRAYCRAVLRLVEETRSNLAFVGSGIGVAERHSSLGRRIMRIMESGYRGHRRVGSLGLGLVVLVSALCLVVASERPSAAQAGSEGALDAKTREVAEEVNRRLTTWTDAQTFTLAEGQSVDMKLKPNQAAVAAVRITAHLVPSGSEFDLKALDAAGTPVSPREMRTSAIHDGDSERTGVPLERSDYFCKIQLTPQRSGDQVAVEVKVLFFAPPTQKEMEAALLTKGRAGQLQLGFRTIAMAVVAYKRNHGESPASLDLLKMELPRDPYSPSGEAIHYEAQRGRFILSSCGDDGAYGNADDEVLVAMLGSMRSGQRHELYPLPADVGEAQTEQLPSGRRPDGSCLLAGQVKDGQTGRPVGHATVYLAYGTGNDPLFVSVAADGSFEMKDVACGEMSLKVINTAGYQDLAYDPDGKGGEFPRFRLAEHEVIRGIAFELQGAHSISGRVLAENGQPLDGSAEPNRGMQVVAWAPGVGPDAGPFRRQAGIGPDGSYLLDGLPARPLLVFVQDHRAELDDDPYPPRYYPGTFSREEAKTIDFGAKTAAEGIDIRLAKKGGLTLDGRVTRAAIGAPVADALIVALYEDGLNRVTAYTDVAGRYHMEGLGPGAFVVLADARPQGLVRTKSRLTLSPSETRATLDFALNTGVTIKGILVDESGAPQNVVGNRTHGFASSNAPAESETRSISMSSVRHKLEPRNVAGDWVHYVLGEGDDSFCDMIFPTGGAFLVSGMAPGATRIRLELNSPGRQVLRVVRQGKDITESGLTTTAGQTIDDVQIVVGPAAAPSR